MPYDPVYARIVNKLPLTTSRSCSSTAPPNDYAETTLRTTTLRPRRARPRRNYAEHDYAETTLRATNGHYQPHWLG